MRSLSERLDALKRHEYPTTDETLSSVFGLGVAHGDVYRVAAEYVNDLAECVRRLERTHHDFQRDDVIKAVLALLGVRTGPAYKPGDWVVPSGDASVTSSSNCETCAADAADAPYLVFAVDEDWLRVVRRRTRTLAKLMTSHARLATAEEIAKARGER